MIFPWPPSALKPNVKAHWAKKAKAVNEYKETCFYLTKEAKLPEGVYSEMTLIFHPPSKRHFDLDNMLATMKSGIDGMCLALKIDDHCFKKITIEMTEEIGGFVKIDLK